MLLSRAPQYRCWCILLATGQELHIIGEAHVSDEGALAGTLIVRGDGVHEEFVCPPGQWVCITVVEQEDRAHWQTRPGPLRVKTARSAEGGA